MIKQDFFRYTRPVQYSEINQYNLSYQKTKEESDVDKIMNPESVGTNSPIETENKPKYINNNSFVSSGWCGSVG